MGLDGPPGLAVCLIMAIFQGLAAFSVLAIRSVLATRLELASCLELTIHLKLATCLELPICLKLPIYLPWVTSLGILELAIHQELAVQEGWTIRPGSVDHLVSAI